MAFSPADRVHQVRDLVDREVATHQATALTLSGAFSRQAGLFEGTTARRFVKRFVLRSLAGLEPVVAAEVLLRLDRVVEQIGLRELVLSVPDERGAAVARGVVALSTVDDAFLEVAPRVPSGGRWRI